MEVDKKSPVPIYFQLKQIIIEKIRHGIWKSGDMISSEREFSEMFQVSRMTIRQALNELVNEGILYREKGVGTFVNRPRVEQMDIMSFTEAATNIGLEASTKVEVFETEVPDLYIAEKLGLSNLEDVFYMKRVRMADREIIGIEEIYLPARYCAGLREKDLAGSLYSILKNDYGYTIDHIATSIEAVIPDSDDLKLFDAESSIPLLRVTGVNITDSNLKLFYEKSLYRSDKYVLNVNIYNK